MGRSVQGRGVLQPLVGPQSPEELLSDCDPTLGAIISSQPARWPYQPTEDPIWGLVRIVIAQQISTQVACRLADRVKSAHPQIIKPSAATAPDPASLRAIGLTERRAQCCVDIVQRSEEILSKVQRGQPWKEAVAGIKGVGPWTVSVFRIMVLREPDVLPIGDVGLQRAVAKVYGRPRSIERLGEVWRPFRSVACWYLWRTLGNEQLG